MHCKLLVIGEDLESLMAPFDEDFDMEPVIGEDGEEYAGNPDGWWDWYVVGGRWSRNLKVKEEFRSNITVGYCFGEDYKDTIANAKANLLSDIASKKEIDWDYMLSDDAYFKFETVLNADGDEDTQNITGREIYNKFIKDLPDDELLTVVDYHR